jgi:hypothetical protein
LVNGYYKVPSGVYFNGGDFTIMVWIKVRNYNHWSRVIDFGTVPQSNMVILSVSETTTGYPANAFYTISSATFIRSSVQIELNKWKHLTCVFSIINNGFIYIDGVSYTGSVSSFTGGPINILRTSNFVGRSNNPGEADVDADMDELKIFNRALSQQEIAYEMNNNMFL